MEKMNDLKALLKHEVKDLMSAEDQIIEALPAMIEKAQNPALKKALEEHLSVTEMQRSRLDNVQELLGGEEDEETKGFFAVLFGGGEQKCKAMEGILTEGKKIMGEDMSAAVMDAALIAASQKVEHYEIASYGTVASYARQLGQTEAARLLEQTLNEEYDADDKLTELAEGDVNKRAQRGRNAPSNSRGNKAASQGKKAATTNTSKSRGIKKAASSALGKAGTKKVAAPTTAKTSSVKKAASSLSKVGVKQAAAIKGSAKKAASTAAKGAKKVAAKSSSTQKAGNKKAAFVTRKRR